MYESLHPIHNTHKDSCLHFQAEYCGVSSSYSLSWHIHRELHRLKDDSKQQCSLVQPYQGGQYHEAYFQNLSRDIVLLLLLRLRLRHEMGLVSQNKLGHLLINLLNLGKAVE